MHSDAVRTGGQLTILGALCLGLFGVAVWTRVRVAGPAVVAGLLLVGTAIEVTSDLSWGGHYVGLGNIGADSAVTPEALQAWHIGSEFGRGSGFLLLLGLFGAGALSRAMPRWLAWSALVLGICGIHPVQLLRRPSGLALGRGGWCSAVHSQGRANPDR